MISADYRVNWRAKLEKHLLQLHQKGTEPDMLPAFSQRSSAVWSKSWEYSHGWSIAESGFQSGWNKEMFMLKSSTVVQRDSLKTKWNARGASPRRAYNPKCSLHNLNI